MNDKPELDKRKAFILATVVYEYINTAEPVGSVTLTQKYNLGVSSATIRNEMAELEAQGYLVQPHTSAGRIPSDAGYRTYVDQLMRPEPLQNDEQRRILDEFRAASRELDDAIEHTTRLLGQRASGPSPSEPIRAWRWSTAPCPATTTRRPGSPTSYGPKKVRRDPDASGRSSRLTHDRAPPQALARRGRRTIA